MALNEACNAGSEVCIAVTISEYNQHIITVAIVNTNTQVYGNQERRIVMSYDGHYELCLLKDRCCCNSLRVELTFSRGIKEVDGTINCYCYGKANDDFFMRRFMMERLCGQRVM